MHHGCVFGDLMWEKLFNDAVKRAKGKIADAGLVAVGFNTNIDAIVRIDTKLIGELMNKEGISETAFEDMAAHPVGKIENVRDFIAGIVYYMNTGLGGEWLIKDEGTFKWIDEHFKGEYKMGGNCGIMSNVLSVLGVKVLSHASSRPVLQMELFEGNNVMIATQTGMKGASEAARECDPKMVHFILEFRKGDELSVGSKKVVAHSANRFIATYDPANTRMEIDKAFRKELVKNIDIIQAVILSGFHLLDRENYRARIKETIDDILSWKKIKRDLVVHTEFADMHDREMMRYYIEMMGSVVDSIGMNEDELAAASEVLGRGMRGRSAPDVFLDASWLYSRLGVKRLVVHTRKFSIAITKGNAEEERGAMLFGGLGAATRAYTGKFGTLKDISATNKALDVDTDSINEEKALQSVVKTFDGIGKYKNAKVVFVPVKYCENPVNTVGLGDCFTACNIAVL